jgi:hypothetical protein
LVFERHELRVLRLVSCANDVVVTSQHHLLP